MALGNSEVTIGQTQRDTVTDIYINIGLIELHFSMGNVRRNALKSALSETISCIEQGCQSQTQGKT